ncbi:exfoliative toxin A/B [Tindallia magadiensis]|uniref:Exfoliative toxin A/B n=1 Tax=Tindallia magadiensis TaxID=69895 RepID=A0A1I3HBX9_9FIRM|nr:TDT family transporter [Tindallia magadiensis]SFI33139.1 exfoliative toxin A/B [Tindallia magadiensis]
MKALLQKLPLPISGLMLGLAALGNLLGTYHMGIRSLLGIIAGIIFIGLLLKIVVFPGCLKEGFSNPVVACIMATFPMGIMLLSTYVRPFLPGLAFGAWMLGIFMNALLVVLFTKTHFIPFAIKKVFSSYFVLYVGIVVGSVTAPLYGMQSVGQILFWFGLAVYLPLIPLVSYRVFKVGGIPEPAQPVIIIYAAPASLLLAGYLSSFPEKNLGIVMGLGTLAFMMTLYGLSQMPRLLKFPFYPSYSAFTFPFVISAIAFNGMTSFLAGQGFQTGWMEPIRIFQIAWATVMVLYVLFRYVVFLSYQAPQTASPEKAYK